MPNATPVRVLRSNDLPLVLRLLNTSDYIYQRFTLEELPMLLKYYPAVGMFNGDSMRGFLLSQTVNPPAAWIGGFGVSWTESHEYISLLEILLEQLEKRLITRGVRYLYYSGNDMQNDWLRDVLLVRSFALHRLLYSYDKYDYSVPATGNPEVKLRPVEKRDIQALLTIEEACFEDFWRYDALSFEDIAATHPYFVVAELKGKVIGYQFNALENEFGYLVRIAVHPSVHGQGIGVRLMSEAITFFQKAHILRIMLNTQDDNTRAHRLYEWFGFVRINQTGFVLRKTL
ncbi:MAG TPA: GNAT family N-acetyltransferase [Ktedonobacteraceae bacterium]|nr:GNAT family N-acetyltransferase [Ktedonobacteraceae bacterium]HXZ03471.1 GNAT family N-acetyltransferase [Ktedonobacteraceae bacterium]HYB01501.1 GNAT family N-acetyltransferase [Ktedonobacteraceae bacterium]